VRLIQEHLKPAIPVDAASFPPLLTDLDSEDFDTRSRAYDQLAAMGDLATLALRKVLEKPPSLEVKRRAQTLLDRANRVTPEHLRALRALTILERIDSTGARQVIQALGHGATPARLTAEARNCLKRLAPD
jgi:hypothetical protein